MAERRWSILRWNALVRRLKAAARFTTADQKFKAAGRFTTEGQKWRRELVKRKRQIARLREARRLLTAPKDPTIGLLRTAAMEMVPAVTTCAGLLAHSQEETMFSVDLRRTTQTEDLRKETGATIQPAARRHSAGRW